MIDQPPSPGSLVQLDPEKWGQLGAAALVIDTPRGLYTDTDFMGRPYVWLLAPGTGRLFQVPLGHVVGLLSPSPPADINKKTNSFNGLQKKR